MTMSKKVVLAALGLVLGIGSTPAWADLYQAAAAFEKKDLPKSFELYRELAEMGHPLAQEVLAVMYVNGEGVARDNVLGYAWAKLALENGGGEAARGIISQLEPHLKDAARERIAAVHAQFGNEALKARLLPGPTPPPGSASPCWMKSAADPDRFFPLEVKRAGISGEVIVHVRVGQDGSVRLPRALYSFPAEVFEEAGRAVALHSRYRPRIENGQFLPCTMRFKVKFTVKGSELDSPSSKALKVIADLRAKAEAGDPHSQLGYGMASGLRPEFRRESEKNTDWFLKAAQAGVPAAQFLVGAQLISADAQPAEQAKGLRWLELAAKNGSGAAMTALAGTLLAEGQDEQHRKQGFDWLERASSTRHREAKFLFAGLLATWPDPDRRDPKRSLELMNEIADSFDYDPLAFEIRAAASAARGEFTAATRAQSTAISKARALNWDTQAMQARLAAYQSKQPAPGELLSF